MKTKRKQLAADIARAKEQEKAPYPQCCFGIAAGRGSRCKAKAVVAVTYYGFTTGLSWCGDHGQRSTDYPHGLTEIKNQ